MRAESIGYRAFDSEGLRDDTSNGAGGTYCANGSYGCNAWATNDNFSNGTYTGTVLKDAELNTYLNGEYLETLSQADKVVSHNFSVGVITYNNNDLAAQIEDENLTTWNGKIGLITASEYLRANTNTDQCETFSLNNDNRETCLTTNWMYGAVPSGGYLWTISPFASYSDYVFCVYGIAGDAGDLSSCLASTSYYVVSPVLYLSFDITLQGEGTSQNPYVITN